MKMAQNHHKVPQWLLKKFAYSTDNKVHFLSKVFQNEQQQNKVWNSITQKSVRSIFYVENLHAFKEHNFEQKLTDLENKKTHLDKIIHNKLKILDLYSIAEFIYSFLLREELLEMTTSTYIDPLQTHNIKNQKSVMSLADDLNIEHLMNSLNDTGREATLARFPLQKTLVTDYDWNLLDASQSNIKFIIGDIPLMTSEKKIDIESFDSTIIISYACDQMVMRQGEKKSGIRIALNKYYMKKHNSFILPISPQYALCLVKKDSPILMPKDKSAWLAESITVNKIPASINTVRIFNKYSYYKSFEGVISSSKKALEELINDFQRFNEIYSKIGKYFWHETFFK